jgi:hypothetical protein
VQLLIYSQPSVHIHTGVWTQTGCTVTQTDCTDTQTDCTVTQTDCTDTQTDGTDTQTDRTDTQTDRTDTQTDRTDTQTDRTVTQTDRTVTQTDRTVTQTSLCKRKLWEGQPWEFSRPSVLYASGKISNLKTATFAYTCVQCAVSSYELVVGCMVLYTVTVRM